MRALHFYPIALLESAVILSNILMFLFAIVCKTTDTKLLMSLQYQSTKKWVCVHFRMLMDAIRGIAGYTLTSYLTINWEVNE